MRRWNEEARRQGEGPGALRAGVAAARRAGLARANGLQPAAVPAGTARAGRRPGGPGGRDPASRPGKVCARGPVVAVGRHRGKPPSRGGAGRGRRRRVPFRAPLRALVPVPSRAHLYAPLRVPLRSRLNAAAPRRPLRVPRRPAPRSGPAPCSGAVSWASAGPCARGGAAAGW